MSKTDLLLAAYVRRNKPSQGTLHTIKNAINQSTAESRILKMYGVCDTKAYRKTAHIFERAFRSKGYIGIIR